MEISGKSCRLNRHAFSYAKGACRVPRVPPLFAYSFENELGWKNVFDIELMSSIGRSAFGEVFMGRFEGGEEIVAVKRMPKERGKQSRSRTIEKIQQEATTLGMMSNHPGVAHLLSTYEDADHVHLVTSLCPGGDLQKLSESIGPLDEASLSLAALEMTRVIADCHQLGIVHGDIKPGNFCLADPAQRLFPYLPTCPVPTEPSPTSTLILDSLNNLHSSFSNQPSASDLKHCLKLIDFGSAQILGMPPSKRSSRRTGTPAFMSAQVFARDYGLETDIWSLGVSLYWLKSNQLPFLHGSSTGMKRIEDLEAAVNNNEISFKSEPFQNMSEIGIDFLSRCLCRSEKERMTAKTALSHPWLVSAADNQERLIHAFCNQPVVNVLDMTGLRLLTRLQV